MSHDSLCYVAQNGGNCCPWLPSCDCQCMCDYIREVRNDVLNMVEAAINVAVDTIDKFDWISPTYAKAKVISAVRELRSSE